MRHGVSAARAAVAAIAAAARTAQDRVNLVPSETRMSPFARLPLQTDFYFRYFFNEELDPHFWQFRGGQDVGFLEHQLAIPALQRLSKAEHVNIRPRGGLNTMLLVASAFGGATGSSVACIDTDSGGHFATESLMRRLGLVPTLLTVEAGKVDPERFASAMQTNDVSLVYFDLQNTLYEFDVRGAVEIVRSTSPKTWVHVDASHTLGLVLGGAHANPLDHGADSFGGSTHKSFPGPQKGVVMTRDRDGAEKLRQAQFDLVSNHHFADTLALGLAAAEFETYGARYSMRVIENAKLLAKELQDRGFVVLGEHDGYTDTHQIWVQHGDTETVYALSDALFKRGIAVNIQDDLPGIPGPALRLGTNEATFEGATSESMQLLATAFAEARDRRGAMGAPQVRASFGEPHHAGEVDLSTLNHA